MCRLYGLHASHPTTPSCELIDAQNSLLKQSLKDERGSSNPHGWGIGHVLPDGSLDCERQMDPAHESEEYRSRSTSIESISVVAHVRRATVGDPKFENTHPFRARDSLLVHNGHIGKFATIRPRMVEAMGEEWAESIGGDTDSEHVFRLLMSRLDGPERGRDEMIDVLAATATDVIEWCAEAGAYLALNVIWAVGEELVGTRYRRTLDYVERDHAYECPVCGHHHGPPDAEDYRAVIVASEEVTASEEWRVVDDEVVWWIDDDFRLKWQSL